MNQINMKAGPEDIARAEALWDFSFALWREADVEVACLQLQEDEAADINIMLFLCWLAREGWAPLEQPLIRAAMDISTPWQTGVVKPLRKLRKELKQMLVPEARSIRASVQQSEIAAERAEQRALVMTMSVLEGPPDVRPEAVDALASAMGALRLYMGLLGLEGCESKGLKKLQAALERSSVFSA